MESLNDVFPHNARQKGIEFNRIWGPPLILDAQGRSTGELNPKHKWDKANNEGSKTNAKALFSIFNIVYLDEFRRITNCKCAKEAWEILQVTHEVMFVVKISKLQMLVTKFENIKMLENKNFSSFYYELSGIINCSFNLGEPIIDYKVLRKILRYLKNQKSNKEWQLRCLNQFLSKTWLQLESYQSV